MPFSPEIKAEALIACGRRCCVCLKFCGVRMECHHIVPEANGGKDDLDNCIPLCFDCHAEAQHYNPKHPKGNKFTPEELRGHRANAHHLLREAIIQDMERGAISADDAVEAAAQSDPKEPELTSEEVKILTWLATSAKDDGEVIRVTTLSETRAKFYLGELKRKKMIFLQSFLDGRSYWHLTHDGRRYLVTRNLVE